MLPVFLVYVRIFCLFLVLAIWPADTAQAIVASLVFLFNQD